MKRGKTKNRLNGLMNLRDELGFSQEMMAMFLGVSLSTVKLAELGDRSLPTDVLIKVANLKIQLSAGSKQDTFETVHAEEHMGDAYQKMYDQFFFPETDCCCLIARLSMQLEACINEYAIIRNKLQVIETVITNNKDDLLAAENWKKQRSLAIKALHKCGLPVQALLKSRIHFLENQVALYKKLKEQLQSKLPTIFKNNKDIL